MRRILIGCFALLAAALPVGVRGAAAAEAASVEATVAPGALKPGGAVEVAVKLSPGEGVHLYRDKVKIALVEPAGGLSLGRFELPAGKKVADPLSGEQEEYYYEPVTIAVPVLVPADFKGDRASFALRVGFQGCTEQFCLPPASRELKLEAPVTGSPAPAPDGAEPPQEAPEKPGVEGGPAPASTEGAAAPDASADRSALVAILLAFLSGLAVCLTPCIYPMIPVTVALIGGVAVGKDGTKSKGTILAYTLVYILGIALMYAALGVIVGLAGSSFGSWMGYRSVQVGIGLIMAALALSMFGAYDLTLGSGLAARFGVKGDKATLPVLLVSGALVGLVASPCVSGPLIGLLAVIGRQGRPIVGGLSLFAFAWGMSALLIVAGLFPGLLARPGEWMNRVKTAFGLVLAAMGLYFARDALPAGAFGWVGVAAALAGGVALIVVARRIADGSRARSLVGGLGAIGLVVAAYFGLGLAVRTGAWSRAAEAALPARVAAMAPDRGAAEVEWRPYSPEALEAARAAGRPAVVDFYATWCGLCLELDHKLFADRRVAAELRAFALLRVDGSEANETATAAAARFGGNYPTVIVFDRQGREVARFLGDARPEAFLEKLRAAR